MTNTALGAKNTHTTKIKGQNQLLGAASYVYSDEEKGEMANRAKKNGAGGTQVRNLLKNGSFEYEDSWGFSGMTGSGYTHSLSVSGNRYIGTKSAYIKNSKETSTGTGNYNQEVSGLEPGTYTASVYVKAKNMSGGAAALKIVSGGTEYSSDQMTQSVEEYQEVQGAELQEGEVSDEEGGGSSSQEDATTPELNNGWRRLAVTFEVKNTSNVKLLLEFGGGQGDVWFDCAQLEKGSIANQYNILENGSFEMSSSSDANQPFRWASKTSDNIKFKKGSLYVPEKTIDGKRCYKMEGESTGEKSLEIAPKLGSSQSSYILSGFVKTTGVPEAEGRCCEIAIYNSEDSLVKRLKINNLVEDWNYVSMTLPTKNWSGYTIKIKFNRQCGDLLVDDFMLVKNEVQTQKYDSEGELTNMVIREKKVAIQYNERGLVKSQTSPGGNKTSYSYDTMTNELERETQTVGPTTEYSYDKYGNQISKTVKKNDKVEAKIGEIYTETAYTADGRFVESTTDSRGNVEKVSYDPDTGELKQAINAAETASTYGYNSDHQITTIQEDNTKVAYEYDNKEQLKKIISPTMNYEVSYDTYGNTAAVKAFGNNLISYEYGKNNGKLSKVTYGNGNTYQQEYNEKEQSVADIYNNEKTDTYEYENTGKLARHKDLVNGLKYEYDYNTAGYVTYSSVFDSKKGKTYEYQNTYDEAGRVKAYSYKIDDKVRTYQYGFRKDDATAKTILPNKGTLSYSYDSLSRVKKKSYQPVAENSAPLITTDVTYLEGVKDPDNSNKLRTTDFIKTYQNTIGKIKAEKETLSYDVLGNLTGINYEGGAKKTYRYDKLSQLTEAVDEKSQMSYQYQYDAGGNLIQAIENDLKTGTQKTNSYGYDSTYRDQLISYNGSSIRYDKGGNPTEYLGKTLSWTKGRQLANVAGTTYTYTSDGTRLSKKTGEKETTYILDGDMILAEKTGDENLHYYYSQGGSVVSIGYQKGNAEEVYYTLLRNSSGDITDIYDAKTGARVGGYQYDAWGAVLSATKESETSDPNNIVTKNPFRFQGYYYDQETGWYYLQSRYYDPIVKRFINADSTDIYGNNDVNSTCSICTRRGCRGSGVWGRHRSWSRGISRCK